MVPVNRPLTTNRSTAAARELLQSENDRLRRENTTLRSAFKAASRIVAPYADDGA